MSTCKTCLGVKLAFRKGNQPVVILLLCALILARMVDFAVFDDHGHDHNNDHSSSEIEVHHTASDHEDLDKGDLHHSNDHALHDMYHAVSSTYIQPIVGEFEMRTVVASLIRPRYSKFSKTISFIPPVPPPLA